MPKKQDPLIMQAWTLDQIAKSMFFKQKAQEWGLLGIAEKIETIAGENLNWDELAISQLAWNKIIHRGIRPVLVFAHPTVLQTLIGSVGYYRMLALVSQKSMKRLGMNVDAYEAHKPLSDDDLALKIARHLNHLISLLIESDDNLNPRNFDIWRGMSAGTQAQGAWQNNKGASAELVIKQMILQRLLDNHFISEMPQDNIRLVLRDKRVMIFADEPDVAIYLDGIPHVAIEIKGGIDPAGVLERVGATLKSLQRTHQENPNAHTILIMQNVAMTQRAKDDLLLSSQIVTAVFGIQTLLDDESERLRLFELMQI
ncbi:MAG: XcyI family restriction endonuclease [Anaerolineae bacterium]|nr:XcyI family restriction endonuclease [Anaerolineae bacterium]